MNPSSKTPNRQGISIASRGISDGLKRGTKSDIKAGAQCLGRSRVLLQMLLRLLD